MNSTANDTLEFILEAPDSGDAPIYIAGNFNDWNARDEQYQLEKTREGHFRIVFHNRELLPSKIEYKYTRGNWDRVELNEKGNGVPNRIVFNARRVVQDRVDHWMGIEVAYKPNYLPEIYTLSEAFEMPKPIKTRRVTALLPHDYNQSDKRYPVLYLQDGQNLFDEYAPFGSWGVDKKLAHMSEQGLGDIIVVAIDHAEEDRIKEFTPSSNTRLGSGYGKHYVRYLTEILKPFVDKKFRTLSDRHHTGIGGSSMGGLISIYAGLMYPEVYSKLMIFSPSLWVAPKIHFHSIHFVQSQDTKIYLYGGEAESVNMIPNLRRFRSALEEQGNGASLEFELNVDPYGQHNETRWGEEFPRAVEWLFFKK